MELEKAFNEWVDARLDILREHFHPLYLEQYKLHGKGMLVFEFTSLEAIPHGELTGGFCKLPPLKERLPPHQRMAKHQGKKWLPLMGLIPSPDGKGFVFTSLVLGWDLGRKTTRIVCEMLEEGGDVYVASNHNVPFRIYVP